MTIKKFILNLILIISVILLSSCKSLPISIRPIKENATFSSTTIIKKENTPKTNQSKNNPIEVATKTVLIFGGDVMLSRKVEQQMKKYQDYTWPFKKIANLLSDADITIINLESPFIYSANYFVPTGSFNFKANPQAIKGLLMAGIDLVTLANNHFGNQGIKGMTDTFKILKENNIAFVGAGNNSLEANQPTVIRKNEINFAFLNYGYPEFLYVANSSTAGIANMNLKKMEQNIKEAKQKYEVVIVIMHAGNEYTHQPNHQQQEFARKAIEAGADLVIGHHPHWVQTTEIYQGKPIIYSLGNLIFDQMWSKETQQGVLAKVIFKNNEIISLELIPIETKNYGQAEIISEVTEKQNLFSKIGLTNEFLIKQD